MSTEPKVINGIPCYAPELAHENKDYPADHFEQLFKLEAKHFWFRSRNKIIQKLLTKFLPPHKTSKILEVGCGTGYVLSGLSKFPNYRLTGADLHIKGLIFAKKRLPQTPFVQVDFRRLPFYHEFDAVGAFDVLEHIEEDEEAIKSAHQALKPHGFFMITVPQHRWLWSQQDEAAYHKRRYTRRELCEKLKKNGFTIRFSSSFVCFLLPLMLISRLRQKKISAGHKEREYNYDELRISRFINVILRCVMRMDEWFIQHGISLPFGGSIIIVSQKK
ncbi:MAG: class I SAM-dependent methyltransferase [Patescibacteria group bacterium]